MTDAPVPSGAGVEVTTPVSSLVGATLGRFRILRKLGRGGFADVWLAEDATLGRHVALKTLLPELAVEPRARARFLREARAESLLDHPCIATVYEFGESAGRPFIAMAYIEGESLAQRIKRGPVPVERALCWAKCAGEALVHAHGRGVLHRDISPQNIMLRGEDDRVFLVDFGLALVANEARLTQDGLVAGTYGYMAPEMVTGGNPDPRSDLYSLGVVLFQLLTGRLPFETPSLAAYCHAVLHSRPADPLRLRPDLPAGVAALLLRAIARDANERFQHADDFVAAVRRELEALAGAPDLVTRPPLPTPTPSPRTPPGTQAAPDPAAHEHYLQALAYMRRPDQEASVSEAIRILKKLLVSEHGPASVRAALARAYLFRARQVSDPALEERAAHHLERAQARDPRSADVLLAQGDLLRSQGRHADAIIAYHRALDLRHDLIDAWVGLGYACEAIGQFESAEDACRQAIAAAPGDWRGYARLAGLYFNRGEFARAIDPWRRVVAAVPDHARAWWNLGSAYFELDRLEDALDAYHRSLEIQPSAIAHMNHATVLYYLGRHDEAIESYERAVALGPGEARTWGNLGAAAVAIPGYEERGREALERAVSLMRVELERRPGDARNWGWLAFWLSLRGRAEEARAALARALEGNSAGVHSLVVAGEVHFALGEPGEAIAAFEQAVRRGHGIESLRRDPFLARLREHPGWTRIEAAAQERSRAASTTS